MGDEGYIDFSVAYRSEGGAGYNGASTFTIQSVANPSLMCNLTNLAEQLYDFGTVTTGIQDIYFKAGTIIYDNAVNDPKITSLSLDVANDVSTFQYGDVSAETVIRGDGYMQIYPCISGTITPVITAENGFDMSKLSGKIRYEIDSSKTHGICCMDNSGNATFSMDAPLEGRGEWSITCYTLDGSNLKYRIDGICNPNSSAVE